MGKVRPRNNLEKELWNTPQPKRKNKAMERADKKLAKFAKNAEDRTYTLHEIAEAMGVTRERVRQIEARALKKLHKRLGQVFKNENITPDDAKDVIRKVSKGGMEHSLMQQEDEQ